MDFWNSHALSIILFLPAAFAVMLIFLPDRYWKLVRGAVLAVSLLDLGLTILLLKHFQAQAGFQFVERAAWITRYNVYYYLGVDGLGLTLVLLTAFLTPLAVLAPFDGVEKYRSAFYASLLFLETGMLGVFMSLDLILFYLFWEAMLLPVYFIIGVWGGERRIYAAVKFIIYTLAGSLLMLVGIMVLYNNHIFAVGYGTFSFPDLTNVVMPAGLQAWLFAVFFISFAIKAPVFPFHTWLPDAYCESPTTGSVIMAGILSKMGVYGFLRFCIPLFPDTSMRFAPWAITLAVISIIYGAFLALAQEDLKKLVAYSSISHLGFIALGIFVFNTQGATGAVVQMVSHGLVTGSLFVIAGMIYSRVGTRGIPSLGGLSRRFLLLAVVLTFFSLASMGMPGLSSFIGEFLIISGAFRYRLAVGFLCAVGLVLGSVYILRMIGKVVFGEWPKDLRESSSDLTLWEVITLVPLAVGIIWIGLFPQPLIKLIQPSLEATLKKLGGM